MSLDATTSSSVPPEAPLGARWAACPPTHTRGFAGAARLSSRRRASFRGTPKLWSGDEKKRSGRRALSLFAAQESAERQFLCRVLKRRASRNHLGVSRSFSPPSGLIEAPAWNQEKASPGGYQYYAQELLEPIKTVIAPAPQNHMCLDQHCSALKRNRKGKLIATYHLL